MNALSSNRLASNRLASNRLPSNRLRPWLRGVLAGPLALIVAFLVTAGGALWLPEGDAKRRSRGVECPEWFTTSDTGCRSRSHARRTRSSR
ncbi:MAG: hypothetical protein WDO68_23395 [Gammaproteobacteria bacterium]